MELRQLRYFLAVSEHLNFSKAARSLGMAQPPLSIQIRKLEGDLGFALFDRRNRQIELTPAGRVFADEAQAVLALSQDAVRSAQDAAHGRAGKITLGFTPGALSERITRRIRKFLRKNRGLRLVTLDAEAARKVPSDAMDALIAEFAESELPDEAVILERNPVCVAVPPKHRLCGKSEVTLADLIGEAFLVSSVAHRSPPEEILLSRLDNAGLPAATEPGLPDRHHRFWQVSLGLGCAIGSSADRSLLDAHLLVVRDCPEPVVTAMIFHPRSKAAGLPAFAEAIRESETGGPATPRAAPGRPGSPR